MIGLTCCYVIIIYDTDVNAIITSMLNKASKHQSLSILKCINKGKDLKPIKPVLCCMNLGCINQLSISSH